MAAQQVFEKLDRDNNGKLSFEEFSEATLVFSPNATHEEIDSMFKDMDVNGDGEIGEKEFTSCIEKSLREIFYFYDVDGDGKIPANKFYAAMTHIEKECTEEHAEKVQAAELDGDGFFNFEEFVAMVLSDAL